MKKFIKTLAATLATVLVFGMTVSAAESPSTTTASPAITPDNAVTTQNIQKAGATKGVTKDGTAFKLDMAALDKGAEQEFVDYANANGFKRVVASFDMNAGGRSDFTAIFKVASVSKEADLSLITKVDGKIVNLGKMNNNGDQTWSIGITHNSPYAIVEGVSAATVVAPKTGEVIALSAIIAIIMMAGAVLCAKKARLQK